MFGNQTLLCQVVLPVPSCAAAIRPDRERAWERAWRARPAGRLAKLLGLTVTSVQFDKLTVALWAVSSPTSETAVTHDVLPRLHALPLPLPVHMGLFLSLP